MRRQLIKHQGIPRGLVEQAGRRIVLLPCTRRHRPSELTLPVVRATRNSRVSSDWLILP